MRRSRALCGTVVLVLALPVLGAQVQQLPPGTSVPGTDAAIKAVDADTTALQTAEQHMTQQDWTGAEALLAPLLQRRPNDAQVLYDLGFCKDARNDVEGAASAYRQAMHADPQSLAPAVGLGLLLARSGDAAGAVPVLQKAVTLPGDDRATTTARAQAYRALARLQLASFPEQSRDDLVHALRLAPETPDDIQLAGEIAEALQDDGAAAAAYARILRATPGDAAAAIPYARVLVRQQHAAEALHVVDAALAVHPDDPDLLGEKASLLLGSRQFAEAIPLLERLQASRPESLATTRLLARAYVAHDDFARGDALFRQLLQAEPKDGALLTEWADSLMRQRRSAEAQTLLERALTSTFSNPTERAQAAAELAFAASANHQPNVVLRAISIRNETEPMNAPSAFLLAAAHDTLHQSREAAGAYRQFLELAQGQFPDEEAQARQRLQALSRTR